MHLEAAGVTLPAMGFLIAALGLLPIIRRMMPGASFCSMMVGSRILVVLLLVAYLATGLTTPNVQLVCAVLFPVWLAFAFTIFGSSYRSDEEASLLFPLLAALASRAPPVS